ncbi:MAG: tellurite resistance/C4-dicarboxylate transporter family protein [Betaproteobacteria bacterium]
MPADPPSSLRDAFPSYFAMVMATGIVSMALQTLGHDTMAAALFAFNLAAYAALWGVGGARMLQAPQALARGITDHLHGPQFLTIVAATNVLGAQCAGIAGWEGIAAVMWVAGLVLWALVTYTFFAAVTVAIAKPGLELGISGAWLLVTVSTESVAVLGAQVAPHFARADIVMFASLCFFLAGGMLYILVIALIFMRWTFLPMHSHTLTPTYWINMGAVAITTLAGARLLEVSPAYPFIDGLTHFVAGLTLFFWATGTWWIPLLLVVFAWRHLRARAPVRYDSQYWSMVFPLGMYSVATTVYATDNALGFLLPLARFAGYVAAVAWAVTTIGLIRHLLRLRAGSAAG